MKGFRPPWQTKVSEERTQVIRLRLNGDLRIWLLVRGLAVVAVSGRSGIGIPAAFAFNRGRDQRFFCKANFRAIRSKLC